MRSSTIISAIALTGLIWLPVVAQDVSPDKDQTIRELMARVTALEAENASLKLRLPTTNAATSRPESPLVYNGHVVDDAWVMRQYAKYGAAIYLGSDGKYHNLLPNIKEASQTAPPPGTIINSFGKVVQVLGKSDILAWRWARASLGGDLVQMTIHIRDLDTSNCTDGADASQTLVYVGTYQYVDVAGAKTTVQDYCNVHRLTKDQFVEALRSGIELWDYIPGRKMGDGTTRDASTRPASIPRSQVPTSKRS